MTSSSYHLKKQQVSYRLKKKYVSSYRLKKRHVPFYRLIKKNSKMNLLNLNHYNPLPAAAGDTLQVYCRSPAQRGGPCNYMVYMCY